MRTVRVHYEDGNTVTTQINGTEAEITRYYVGNAFQFGDTDECPRDKLVKATKVEFMREFAFRVDDPKDPHGHTVTSTDAFTEEEARKELAPLYEGCSLLYMTEQEREAYDGQFFRT
jgi:hypothetical protein